MVPIREENDATGRFFTLKVSMETKSLFGASKRKDMPKLFLVQEFNRHLAIEFRVMRQVHTIRRNVASP